MTFAKRIASATAQLLLSNALVRLFSLVTMPVLTHLLAPEAYGTVAIAGTAISLVSVVALTGMDMSYVRAFHAKGTASGQEAEAYAWRYVLVGGVVVGGISALLWKYIVSDIFSLPAYLAGFIGIGVLLAVSREMTTIRARLNNRYRAMSLSIVLSGLGAAAISLGVAYWWRQDELPLVLSLVAGNLIPILTLGIPSLKTLCRPSGLDRTHRLNILRIGLAGIVTAPMQWIMSSADRWFLGYFEDAASVGIYSIGYNVGIMGMMINSSVTSVWLPEAAKVFEERSDRNRDILGQTIERLVACYAIVWLAISAAGGDIIRLLTAPAFHEAASIVPLIAGAVFFDGVNALGKTNLLLVKKLHYSIWSWIVGGSLCFLFNLLLVPSMGRVGAALTQATTFAVIAAGMSFLSHREFPISFHWRRLGLLLCGVTAFGVVMVPAWANTPILSLLFKLPVGLLAGVVILRYCAPEEMRWVARRFALAIQRG